MLGASDIGCDAKDSQATRPTGRVHGGLGWEFQAARTIRTKSGED